jgi:hypothetical protein
MEKDRSSIYNLEQFISNREMSLFLVWSVIPILGALRNYAKYHVINPVLFIRTPVLTGVLYLAVSRYTSGTTAVLLSALSERWVMLFYKMGLSVYNNDYIVKKNKYIDKYNLKYD